MGNLTINLEFRMAVRQAQERQLGTPDMGNQQQHPIPPPSVAPTPEKQSQYLQYTRSINSKPCPPSYFIKKLVWTTHLQLALAHSLCLILNRLRPHCSRPSSIS